jgi:LmbE family N-acetylglucosaminyl deacetylase
MLYLKNPVDLFSLSVIYLNRRINNFDCILKKKKLASLRKKTILIIAGVIFLAFTGLLISRLNSFVKSPKKILSEQYQLVPSSGSDQLLFEKGSLAADIGASDSVMWIAAHPDDELYLAGILAYMTKTRAFSGTIVAFGINQKLIEGNADSAFFLGNSDYIRIAERLDLPPINCEKYDCFVQNWLSNGTKDELVAIIQEKSPDIIFSFEPLDGYLSKPPHAASSYITQLAIEESGINCHYYHYVTTLEETDQKIVNKLKPTDVFNLGQKTLWNDKLKIIEIYSPFYPSLQRMIDDQKYQQRLIHKEFFNKIK